MSMMKEVVEKQLSVASERTEIVLSNFGLTDDNATDLKVILEQYQQKKIILNLYANNISDEGARQIAELSNIVSLNLSYNNVNNFGFKSLINNSHIRCLDLSGNSRIDDFCIDYVLSRINLLSLSLINTRMSLLNLQKIAERIKQHKIQVLKSSF